MKRQSLRCLTNDMHLHKSYIYTHSPGYTNIWHITQSQQSLSLSLSGSPSLFRLPLDRVSTQPFEKDKPKKSFGNLLFVFLYLMKRIKIWEISCERSSNNLYDFWGSWVTSLCPVGLTATPHRNKRLRWKKWRKTRRNKRTKKQDNSYLI